MTDSIHSITVVLEHDMKENAEPLISAIKCMKGVISVEGNIADYNFVVAEARAKKHYAEKLWEVLYPKNKGDQ